MRAIPAILVISFLAMPSFSQVQDMVTAAGPGRSAPSDNPRAIQTETYGTSALTWLPVSAWQFQPINSFTTYDLAVSGRFGIYLMAGTFLEAPLQLPEGAVVSSLEMTACDTNATGQISVYIMIASTTSSVVNNTPFVSTGMPAVPGCTNFSGTFTPFTVANAANSYTIEAQFIGGGSNNLILHSARVGYKLQVSPAPTTATFTDVPTTHVFFQYIEALAASGITSGCTASTFCPDAPLTRGQMAVFLARALGLHWAP